jgi:hypothetical protein
VWGQGGEMTQAMYAHMNNKIIINKLIIKMFITLKKNIFSSHKRRHFRPHLGQKPQSL